MSISRSFHKNIAFQATEATDGAGQYKIAPKCFVSANVSFRTVSVSIPGSMVLANA